MKTRTVVEVANRNMSSRISFFEVLVSAPARAPRRARFDFLRCTSSTACSFAINTTGPDGSAQIRKFSYIRYITGKKSTSMARCFTTPPKEESKEVADQSLYCTFTLSQNERVAPHYIDVGRPLRRQAGGSDGPSDSRALGRAARKPSSKASAVAPSNLTLHQWCRTR